MAYRVPRFAIVNTFTVKDGGLGTVLNGNALLAEDSGDLDVQPSWPQGYLRDGTKALHRACAAGRVEVVAVMLDAGAEVDTRDTDGWTPLHYASSLGDCTIIQLLREAGADVNARNNDGWTPLHLSCGKGHKAATAHLLVLGACVTATNHCGRSALHSACIEGWPGLAQILIRSGADVRHKDEDAMTALDHARLEFLTETDGLMQGRYLGVVEVMEAAQAAARADAAGGAYEQRWVSDAAGEDEATNTEEGTSSASGSESGSSLTAARGFGSCSSTSADRRPGSGGHNTRITAPGRGGGSRGDERAGRQAAPAAGFEGVGSVGSIVSQEVTSPPSHVPACAPVSSCGEPSLGGARLARAWCCCTCGGPLSPLNKRKHKRPRMGV